jgi:hypothetical protein
MFTLYLLAVLVGIVAAGLGWLMLQPYLLAVDSREFEILTPSKRFWLEATNRRGWFLAPLTRVSEQLNDLAERQRLKTF